MSRERPSDGAEATGELAIDDTIVQRDDGDAPPGDPEAGRLAAGATVGRLIILRTIGEGGMGVVYAAYDPELDRAVAVKLLHGSGAGSESARTRLSREAQALAKLTHPNVVAIHDVGTRGSQVWLSMELVSGQTLRGWRARARPRWREILEVMKQATRGVAAAHKAGLLHRDLKPENIMVGDDGRVRVMDFGLARTGVEVTPRAIKPESATPRLDALSVELTAAGAMVGTPAYMAPEQLMGHPADERTDQFSLCATLWEALFGERAFAGESVHELAVSMAAGRLRRPGAAAPRWLRRVIERGLSARREQRYASVDALLEALEADPTRRRVALGVGVLAVLSLGTYLGATRLQRQRAVERCADEGVALKSTWRAGARERLRAGLLATGAPYAEDAAVGATRYLDAYAEAWADARRESCLDANVRGAWDADALDRSRACLDQRRNRFEDLVEELSQASPTVAARAVSAAAGLPSMASCRDVHRLAMTPPMPGDRVAVQRVQRTLSRAATSRVADQHAQGLELLDGVTPLAYELAWAPLSAALELERGGLLVRAARYEEAERAIERAYFLAARAGALELESDAATHQVYTVGFLQARHDDALLWAQLADVALVSLEADASSLRRATYLNNVSLIHAARGEIEEATRLGERALAMREELLGDAHPRVANSLNNVANFYDAAGERDAALAMHERALAINEGIYGSAHPSVARSLNNLASVQLAVGDFARARARWERALTIYEDAFGPEHPHVATTLTNLAELHQRAGELTRARTMYERALEINESTLGAEHPELVYELRGLAELALAGRRLDDAAALAERAIALPREGGDPVMLAYSRFVLARALWDINEGKGADAARDASLARALTLAREAQAALEVAAGGDALVTRTRAAIAEFLDANAPR